jgi:hypothetical protein
MWHFTLFERLYGWSMIIKHFTFTCVVLKKRMWSLFDLQRADRDKKTFANSVKSDLKMATYHVNSLCKNLYWNMY